MLVLVWYGTGGRYLGKEDFVLYSYESDSYEALLCKAREWISAGWGNYKNISISDTRLKGWKEVFEFEGHSDLDCKEFPLFL